MQLYFSMTFSCELILEIYHSMKLNHLKFCRKHLLNNVNLHFKEDMLSTAIGSFHNVIDILKNYIRNNFGEDNFKLRKLI